MFVTAPTSAVGPPGPLRTGVGEGGVVHSREVNRPEHEADYHHRLVPRLRMSGAVFPLTNMLSWCGASLNIDSFRLC